jgi:hypothetical protein
MSMNDEELMFQAASVSTMYFDGFGCFRKVNGVLRCIGYVLDGGAQLNLVVSLAGADQAQIETRRVLEEKPTSGIHIWTGARLAH